LIQLNNKKYEQKKKRLEAQKYGTRNETVLHLGFIINVQNEGR